MIMTDIITKLEITYMCGLASRILDNIEEMINNNDNNLDNCGMMDKASVFQDLERANRKILDYINSLRGKQVLVTPNQIAEELGMSSEFVESMLIANGFETE